jgi:hypothetical protein
MPHGRLLLGPDAFTGAGYVAAGLFGVALGIVLPRLWPFSAAPARPAMGALQSCVSSSAKGKDARSHRADAARPSDVVLLPASPDKKARASGCRAGAGLP